VRFTQRCRSDLADLYEYGVIAGIPESTAMHQPELWV
jgi:hypothetical protein